MPHVPSFRAVLEDAARRWAVESQQGARRNAMRASTVMAAERKERTDVEDFLATRGLPADPADPADPASELPREAQGGL